MDDRFSILKSLEHLTLVRTQDDLVTISSSSYTIQSLNYYHNDWADKNRFNVPGPFYTGLTDNCFTGIPAAPYNVMVDLDGREFIYRQPRSFDEVNAVIDAAATDPFAAYGWDGNHHWTLSLIRDWWQRRYELNTALDTIKRELSSAIPFYSIEQYNNEPQPYPTDYAQIAAFTTRIAITECEKYWRDSLESYLRVYAFYIDTGKLPADSDSLPDL